MNLPWTLRVDPAEVARNIAVRHPGLWCIVALGVFGTLSVLPVNSWNVEILIARNVLRGNGFVVGPLDPPALWRPPLGVLALVPVEMLVFEPETIYRLYSAVCLTVSSVALFYLAKQIAGLPAAHLSQLLLFTTPAFTSLVSTQLQLMAYTMMAATILTALLATIAQWSRPTLAGDAGIGLAWGAAFLARPEMSLLYLVTFACSGLVYRSRNRASLLAWKGLTLQAAAFAVICLSTMTVFWSVRARHNLLGQVPLITFYAGEYFASGTTAVDVDGEGYAASVRQYGPPAEYGGSFVRFALARPTAVLTRVRQNIDNAAVLLSSGQLVRWGDWLLFVLLASGMALSRAPAIDGRLLALYGALLTGASGYFLLFHVDPRYLLALVLMLLCLTLMATSRFWRWMAGVQMLPRPALVMMALSAIVMAGVSSHRVLTAIEDAPGQAVDTGPFRDLADRFRHEHGASGTPTLGFVPLHGDAMLWISYYANIAIPWQIDATLFPRDRVYSFEPRAADYLLVPAHADLTSLDNPPVLWRWFVPGFGDYVCIAREGV